ncbi:MAG: synthase subunit gamma [Candidatus Parcubacteria bacterium]|jgi:F0F1-type ATP synthase gamma subunit
MSKVKQLKEEYTVTLNIRDLVSTYQEIASIRMRSIRDFVLKNREYFDGVNKVFSLVLNSYQSELENLSIHNKGATSLFRRNGKKVAILLASNTLLYGSIVYETFDKFKDFVTEEPTSDLVIVGKVGKRMFEDAGLTRPYTYFELSDSLDDSKHLHIISDFILQYETVIVYHGSFKTILSQAPTQTLLTGGEVESKKANKNIHFFFEPNLHSVLTYFENQIIASNFEQAVNEGYLSKFASRMISLDIALNGIDKHVKVLNLKKQKVKHYMTNKKQQDTLSGITLWN